MPKKRASAATKAAPSSTTTSATSGETGTKTNALPIYRLKSFSDEKSVNHYSIKKHSSGAMLLEGHGKCTNKIPLSARNTQFSSSSLVSRENEECPRVRTCGSRIVVPTGVCWSAVHPMGGARGIVPLAQARCAPAAQREIVNSL